MIIKLPIHKKFIAFIPSLFCLMVCFSQSFNSEDFRFDKVSLPIKTLPSNAETYQVKISTSPNGYFRGDLVDFYYELDRYNYLHSYQKIPFNADLIIEIEFVKSISIYKSEIKTVDINNGKKGADGKIVYEPAYFYENTVTTPIIKARLLTKAGQILNEVSVGGFQKLAYFGQGSTSLGPTGEYNYMTKEILANDWEKKKNETMHSWESYYIKQLLPSIWTVAFDFDLGMFWENIFLPTIKKAKKFNYDDYDSAMTNFKQGLMMFKKDTVVKINKLITPLYAEREAILKAAAAIWEKMLLEPTGKDTRMNDKITAYANYCLGMCYLYMNNFEEAKKIVVKAGEKKKFIEWERMLGVINNAKKKFDANTWRPLLVKDELPYIYKDAEAKRKEQEDFQKQQQILFEKAQKDSLAAIKHLNKNNPKTLNPKPKAKNIKH